MLIIRKGEEWETIKVNHGNNIVSSRIILIDYLSNLINMSIRTIILNATFPFQFFKKNNNETILNCEFSFKDIVQTKRNVI